MIRLIPDPEIASLLVERKPLEANWRTRLQPAVKAHVAHRERQLDVTGESGHQFRIFVRENLNRLLDFSIGLLFLELGECYPLVRYNGRGHKHTNHLERIAGFAGFEIVNEFHIHRATERYQAAGRRIDGYAEITDKFTDLHSAMTAFVEDNGFLIPKEELPLFGDA